MLTHVNLLSHMKKNYKLLTLADCLLLDHIFQRDFCLRLSGIHKKFKTGLRLSQGLNFKTGW